MELVTQLLLDEVADRVRDRPDDVLLRDVDGRTLSTGDAFIEAHMWADLLERLGVTEGQTVATIIPTSVDAVVAWWGVALLKAIEIPLDPAHHGEVLTNMLNLSRARVLIIDGASVPALETALPHLDHLESVIVLGEARVPEATNAIRFLSPDLRPTPHGPAPRGLPTAADVCCGLFTSGTSGEAKCVLVPWGQLHQMYIEAMGRPWGQDEVMYVANPFNHAIARGMIHRAVTAPNGAAVLRRRHSTRAWWPDVLKHQCTEANIPAVIAHWLLELPPGPRDVSNPLRRVCIYPQVPEAEQFAARFDVEIFTAYGTTEAGISLVASGLDAFRCTGRPVPGVEVRLIDSLTGHELEGSDLPGELQVRERQSKVSLGYLGEVGSTGRDRIGGWISSGDIFTRDATNAFHFVARAKDVIRRRGENISPLTIERAALNHPAVAQAAAVAVPADVADDEVKLFVELVPGSELTPAALTDHLVTLLPAMMVPRFVEIISELPRTATGKVRNQELRQRPARTAATYERLEDDPS